MSLSETARAIAEAEKTLQVCRDSLGAKIAQTLSEAASDLARACESLERTAGREWMDAEQARAHLARRTKKQWEAISPHLPKHYLSPGVALYSKSEIDRLLEFATTPEESLVSVAKRAKRGAGDSGAARSLERALKPREE